MATVHYQGDFEWDDAKAAQNLAKHGVAFEEAATAFFDADAITLGDPQGHDDRYVLIGKSVRPRILFVVPRGDHRRRQDSHHLGSPGRTARDHPLQRRRRNMKTPAQQPRQVTSDDPHFDVSVSKLIRRGPRKDLHIGLATLRAVRELTQAAVADRAGIDQGEVSRLEARGDCRVSTLARYAKAIGGTLKLVVEIDGRPYLIDLGR